VRAASAPARCSGTGLPEGVAELLLLQSARRAGPAVTAGLGSGRGRSGVALVQVRAAGRAAACDWPRTPRREQPRREHCALDLGGGLAGGGGRDVLPPARVPAPCAAPWRSAARLAGTQAPPMARRLCTYSAASVLMQGAYCRLLHLHVQAYWCLFVWAWQHWRRPQGRTGWRGCPGCALPQPQRPALHVDAGMPAGPG
jgi:hypothetical protein